MKTNFHNKPRKPLSRGTKQMKRSGFKKKVYVLGPDNIHSVLDQMNKFYSPSPASYMKRSPLRKVSKDPLQKRYAVLKKVSHDYIKERDKWTCICCGKANKGQYMDAGHFIEDSTGGMALRYHEDNMNAQCRDCNSKGSSAEMRSIYEEALTRKIGAARVSELYRLQHQTITKDFDVEVKIAEFREKLKFLRDK